jgi:cysteinyl-tRNA synthetase
MEATSGKKPLVRFWMHTGFLNVNGEKMAKSLGNFTTIRDMLAKFDADSFRFFVLSSHYHSPIDFSESALEQSRKSLERIRQAAKAIEEELERTPQSADHAPSENEVSEAGVDEFKARFLDSMDNDFNTPYSLKAVFELVREVNRCINERAISKKSLIEAGRLLDEFGRILGISFSPAKGGHSEDFGNKQDLTGNLIELLIDVRQKLRDKKDWALADEMRNRLNEQGIVLEDAKSGGGRYSIK